MEERAAAVKETILKVIRESDGSDCFESVVERVEDDVRAVDEQKTDGEASELVYIPSWRDHKRGRRLTWVTPDLLPRAGFHALGDVVVVHGSRLECYLRVTREVSTEGT